jgi:hypothetical protein
MIEGLKSKRLAETGEPFTFNCIESCLLRKNRIPRRPLFIRVNPIRGTLRTLHANIVNLLLFSSSRLSGGSILLYCFV